MLPDIASYKTASHISGFAQPSGTGILSRSFEDLHPQPDRYEVVWNGTIACQEQKAEQRSPSLELEPVEPEAPNRRDGQPVAETILALLRRSGQALTRQQICTLSGFGAAVVDNAMYRLAADDVVLSCLVLNEKREPGQKQWRRIYSVPAKAAA